MSTTIPSAALVPVSPAFTNAERLALAGRLRPVARFTDQLLGDLAGSSTAVAGG
jgi:hypothetical protein